MERLAGRWAGGWSGSWSRYHGDHRRRHSRFPLAGEKLSLRGLHPALGQASGRPRPLPLEFIRTAEKKPPLPEVEDLITFQLTAIYIL